MRNVFRLRFVPGSQKLEFVLCGPATLPQRAWLAKANELLAGMPCVPTVAEMFARALERCWPIERIRELVAGLYDGALPTFQVRESRGEEKVLVPKTFEMILADGLAWRAGRRGVQDPPELGSDNEWRLRAWVSGRQKLMIPPRVRIFRERLPDNNVDRRHLVSTLALVRDDASSEMPAALFELERSMRFFETGLHLDLDEPVQEPCRFETREAMLVTYASLEPNGLTLPFVHPESGRAVPYLEAMYRKVSVEGLAFREYVAFRRRRPPRPLATPPSIA